MIVLVHVITITFCYEGSNIHRRCSIVEQHIDIGEQHVTQEYSTESNDFTANAL